MRILVFGHPRTRSSFLLDVACKHYELTNYFEIYHGNLINQIEHEIPAHKNISKWEVYKKRVKTITDNLSEKNNFGVKIFSTVLTNWEKIAVNILDYSVIHKDDIINLEEYFKVSSYDKIYITYRKNFTDQFCSYKHARLNDTFVYKKQEKKLAQLYAPKNKKIDYKLSDIKRWVFEVAIQDYFFDYIKNRYSNVIQLEYHDIPNYVKLTYPNCTSDLSETNYNYEESISNYQQISDDFQKVLENFNKSEVFDKLNSLS